MTHTKQPIWKLVQLCGNELTNNGTTPFTRSDLIQCVQRKKPGCGPDSINPIIQGITDNLRGGAPGAVNKDILHSVGRGLFVLKGGSQDRNESPRHFPSDPESDAGPSVGHHPVTRARLPTLTNKSVTVRIGDYDFHHICAIEPERHADGTIVEYMPQARYKNATGLALHRYGRGPFCKFKIPRNIEIAGVYALMVDEEVRYIGECARLSSRYNMGYGNISPRNCFVRGQETNCRINNLVLQLTKNSSKVSLWFLVTKQYKLVERKLRGSLSLTWNRV